MRTTIDRRATLSRTTRVRSSRRVSKRARPVPTRAVPETTGRRGSRTVAVYTEHRAAGTVAGPGAVEYTLSGTRARYTATGPVVGSVGLLRRSPHAAYM